MIDIRTKPLSIYVHIPFCVRKCAYCDFLSGPADEHTKRMYVDELFKQIHTEAALYPDRRVETVFFGGGTPTSLTADMLAEILRELASAFQIKSMEQLEITTECNPGTVDYQALLKLRRAGFNRLSIGLQSADDRELQLLGRIHDYETFVRTWDNARKAGFENINIDLMYALPGQSQESYLHTLRKIAALEPEHISAYSLIIEEGTPFYDLYHGQDQHREQTGESGMESETGSCIKENSSWAMPKAAALPDEDTERRMYELTEKLLGEAGYCRYEISNYAREGKECRHNKVYWQRGEYLGLGLGASSLMENVRWVITDNLQEYIHNNKWEHQNVQILSRKDQMEEFMYLGLRLMKGVSKTEFEKNFHKSMDQVYGDVLKKYTHLGLVEEKADKVMLTKKGIGVSNVVMSDFLIDE